MAVVQKMVVTNPRSVCHGGQNTDYGGAHILHRSLDLAFGAPNI